MGWIHRLHLAKRGLHGDAERYALRGADCSGGLDLEMGRCLSVTGVVARSACQIFGRIAHSFVLRALDTLCG